MDIQVTPFYIQLILEFFKPINFAQFIIFLLFFLVVNRYIYSFIVLFYVLITILLNAYEFTSSRQKLKKISQSHNVSLLVKRKKNGEELTQMLPMD
jgi:hypothetical protein